LVTQSFNDNCNGAKRDVSALRMKLKNLKAHNKKIRIGDDSKIEILEEALDEDAAQKVSNITSFKSSLLHAYRFRKSLENEQKFSQPKRLHC
jgi:hypothetical protein